MSLLLEALKKAEKAKEEAQRRASGGDAHAASAFDPESTVLDDGKHVTRRDELPDISAPLEILSDDFRPAGSAKSAPLELSLADEVPPAPRAASRREGARASAAAAEAQNAATNAGRATAQRVFEAKFKESNPRLPFFVVMGLLSVFAVGTGVYFWLQLRPAPSLVNTNPGRPPDEKPVEVAALPKPAAPGPLGTAQPAGTAPAIPGLPTGTPAPPVTAPVAPPPVAMTPAPAAPVAPAPPAPAPAAAPAAAPVVRAPAPSAPAPSARPAQRSRASAEARGEERAVSVSRPSLQIHPQVAAGYASYQAGDLQKARSEYQQVLREEPANRDALLGLAAVEMRAQRFDQADALYQRVLVSDPRDAHAQAGQLALRSQQLDPVQVESRVKSILAADRDAQVLYFTLGNQYAQQGRWAEAQQAYFKAFAADPENPDYAFNLAISLDQLRQGKLALEYYRKALALTEKRSASFPPETARIRVQQLSR